MVKAMSELFGTLIIVLGVLVVMCLLNSAGRD